MKFLDEAKIYLESGKGGPGCISFHRAKYLEFGGPDGGNGGRGGDVIVRVKADLNTLIDFRYQQHFRAGFGEHGKGRLRTGADGDDSIMYVPVGTQILSEDKETVLYDLTTDGEEIVLLRGGDGGMGNAHYKSSTNQAPRYSTPGFPGQELAIWLRLKLFADAGLVGLPNAGKSTFLSVVSAAKPKIADYPFTTLHPQLGVVRLPNNLTGHSFVLADIPGLIEGAHEGVGLGTRFLGHIERTAVLLHLVDGTSEDVVADYETIRGELEAYGHGLAQKSTLLALNKCDALTADELAEKQAALQAASGAPVLAISGATRQGVDDTIFALWHVIQQNRQQTIEVAAIEQPYDPLGAAQY
jgi:GTPase